MGDGHPTHQETMSKRNSTSLLSEFIDGFAWENRDKRLDGLPLADSVLPTVYICMVYIFLARVAVPKYMENRPAVSTNVVYIYNGMMIVADFTLFAKLLHYSRELGYSWGKKQSRKIWKPYTGVSKSSSQNIQRKGYPNAVSSLITWYI